MNPIIERDVSPNTKHFLEYHPTINMSIYKQTVLQMVASAVFLVRYQDVRLRSRRQEREEFLLPLQEKHTGTFPHAQIGQPVRRHCILRRYGSYFLFYTYIFFGKFTYLYIRSIQVTLTNFYI